MLNFISNIYMKDNIKNVFVRKVKIVNKLKSISAGASVVQWKA